jgi:Mn-dependent DtxR family transcriptional regulator
MSELLKEAEVSCTNILQILEKLEIFPKEKTKEITNKMANILRDISISKKKIMMKSAKGAELSEKGKKRAHRVLRKH